MTSTTKNTESLFALTRNAFIWTRLLSMPFWTIISLFSVFLYKDFHITPFQVTLIVALKPLSALFAPYWSVAIYQRQDRLVSNLVWANILRYTPFLFFPWLESTWLMILSFAIYMILRRGATPAWMEMFKKNIPELARERVFIYGTAIDYLGSAVLPILLGIALDEYLLSWRWLLFISALIGICSTVLLWRMPAHLMTTSPVSPIAEQQNVSWRDRLLKPLGQSWELMKERPDFARFQIGFMLGGAGLMVMQPVLPHFFIDVLNLSYTKLMMAMIACKGIGFALASPFWLRCFRRLNIFSFSAWVIFSCALFPLCLVMAKYQIAFLYIAYVIYGIMQAGSELSWNMSGPIFSKDKDSSLFSRTNLLSVGIRGSFFPLLGSCLYTCSNAAVVMAFSVVLCLEASRRFSQDSKTITK